MIAYQTSQLVFSNSLVFSVVSGMESNHIATQVKWHTWFHAVLCFSDLPASPCLSFWPWAGIVLITCIRNTGYVYCTCLPMLLTSSRLGIGTINTNMPDHDGQLPIHYREAIGEAGDWTLQWFVMNPKMAKAVDSLAIQYNHQTYRSACKISL